MKTPKEVITIRRSLSVVKQFNIYIEKGAAKCRLATGLPEAEALKLGVEYSRLLEIDFETHVKELNQGPQ